MGTDAQMHRHRHTRICYAPALRCPVLSERVFLYQEWGAGSEPHPRTTLPSLCHLRPRRHGLLPFLSRVDVVDDRRSTVDG
eukprot:1876290-Rhodomonas_salina.2